jgi:hypothetical protein
MGITLAPSKSGAEDAAVQTLPRLMTQLNFAKRLDCGGFSTAFYDPSGLISKLKAKTPTRLTRKKSFLPGSVWSRIPSTWMLL